jgi:hypothetical protein
MNESFLFGFVAAVVAAVIILCLTSRTLDGRCPGWRASWMRC